MSSDRFGNIKIKPDAGETDLHQQGPDASHIQGKKAREKKSRATEDPGTPPHIPSRKTPRNKLFFASSKALLCVAIPLFLVLLYGVGSYFLVPALVKGSLSQKVAEYLGRPVAVNRVIFSPFTLEVFLQNVSIGPVYGDQNKENLLECPEFSCRIDLFDLFDRKIVCHEVRINGLTANLIKLRLGSFNIADATNFFSLLKGRSGQVVWPEWLVFDGVQVADGNVIINDSLTNKQHRIEDIRFYIPSANEAADKEGMMPRLNAVINSSPIQIDGIRRKNAQGSMETRFHLKFSKIVLRNYLEYIQALANNPLHLDEGQADIAVEFVIPELSGDEKNLTIQLSADIEALSFSDKSGNAILKIPEASLILHAFPSRNFYLFKNVVFDRAELTVRLDERKQQKRAGLSLDDFNTLITGLDQYAYGIGIENVSLNDGVINILKGRQNTPRFTWEKGQLRLNGYVNARAGKNEEVPPPPSSYWLSATEKGSSDTKFKAEGKLTDASGTEGRFTINNIDLKKYSLLLPKKVNFAQGLADLTSNYTISLQPAKDTGKTNLPGWQLHHGMLTLSDFKYRWNGKNILSGKKAVCKGLDAVSGTQLLTCSDVLIVQSEIDGKSIQLADLAKDNLDRDDWQFTAQNIGVQNSRISLHTINPFADDETVLLALDEFELHVENLPSADSNKANLRMSSTIGGQGRLQLEGSYSTISGKGQLKTTFNNIPLKSVRDYISPWFKPVINEGSLNAAGTFMLPAKEFKGTLSISNLNSEQADESFLGWEEAEINDLKLTIHPFALLGKELKVIKPHILFGITHPEKPLSVFVVPAEEGSENKITLERVTFTNGSLNLPEPIIVEGYQPELSNISGSLTGMGKKLMDFTVQGKLPQQGNFSVKGTTGSDKLESYTLHVDDLQLTPFQPLFAGNIGLHVKDATGGWTQELQTSEAGVKITNRLKFNNIEPDPSSDYFKILSLYTDEKRNLLYSGIEEFKEPSERIFLFDSFFRGIKHDAVRADLSEYLVLNKLLPDLDLKGKVAFVPGTTTLVVNKYLADYEKLLSKRPFLRLVLAGNYDQTTDRQALKKILQAQEDQKREAENKRRAKEREKIIEQEKARLEELKKDQKQVVEEEITPVELAQDLQPLPYKEVQVNDGLLQELARKRANVLFTFFVEGLLVPQGRISIFPETGTKGTEVHIAVLPLRPLPKKENQGERSTATH